MIARCAWRNCKKQPLVYDGAVVVLVNNKPLHLGCFLEAVKGITSPLPDPNQIILPFPARNEAAAS